eukprot:6879778-Pyramimonas_sp.AAC.1
MLTRYALDLISRFCNPGDQTDEMVLGVAQCMARFYEILDNESMFVRPDGQREIKELRKKRKTLEDEPQNAFVTHLCLDQIPQIGNARYFWTYGDEDLVGRLISIAE